MTNLTEYTDVMLRNVQGIVLPPEATVAIVITDIEDYAALRVPGVVARVSDPTDALTETTFKRVIVTSLYRLLDRGYGQPQSRNLSNGGFSEGLSWGDGIGEDELISDELLTLLRPSSANARVIIHTPDFDTRATTSLAEYATDERDR